MVGPEFPNTVDDASIVGSDNHGRIVLFVRDVMRLNLGGGGVHMIIWI